MTSAATTLARWCAIPSHAGDPAGQRRMAADSRGPSATSEPRRSSRSRSPRRPGSPVLLVGHDDTVPHDDDPAAPTVAVEGDRILARGAADMKGGLVVVLGTPWSRGRLAEAARGATAALVFDPPCRTAGS